MESKFKMQAKLQLPEKFVYQLVKLPESGMGFQLVKVFLKNGKILNKQRVLNASVLLLEPHEGISGDEIEKIELDNH
jgi:hypothetical protein